MNHRAPVAVLGARLPAALFATLLMGYCMAAAPTMAMAAGNDDVPSVVVTTEVLGAVVAELVGDAGEVTVLMPGGANPHTFAPSARDAERISRADVVVSNGLDLEEGLLSVLEAAQSEGVTWFQAADHMAVRDLEVEPEAEDAGQDHQDAGQDDEDAGHEHEAADPHFWTDPLLMRDVVAALEPVLAEAGLDVAGNAQALMAGLETLDAEVAEILAVVPQEARRLVTGHRSMGYFAERYGFELIGTVIPSLSTGGEPSARELAQLIADIREQGVPAIFVEVGTPQSVAQAVADDSGTRLVALSTSELPDDGSYGSFMRDIATTVADALGG